MTASRKLVIALGVLLVCIVGHDAAIGFSQGREMRSLEAKLHAELRVGDPAEKIETVLRANNLPVRYDDIGRCYRASSERRQHLLAKTTFCSVYIYVDEARKLVRIEVRAGFVM